jgi:hypothetical protein
MVGAGVGLPVTFVRLASCAAAGTPKLNPLNKIAKVKRATIFKWFLLIENNFTGNS